MTLVKFRLRRDTAANWTAANPTLGLGEPGFETDSELMKIGDGATVWTSLAYVDAKTLGGHLASAFLLASMLDTDGALAANSDAKIASQKATKTYVDTAVTGLLDFKGSTSCSANPNYPAALKGDAYIVSAAGKIGGASGKSVDIGDVYLATADNAGGTEASVGASWSVLEHNLVGALLAANNLSDVASASTARTNLGLAIGTNVQAFHANLAAFAALALLSDTLPYGNGAGTLGLATFTSFGRNMLAAADAAAGRSILGVTSTGNDTTYMFRANNLSDVGNAGTARTNLGLGTVATLASDSDTTLAANSDSNVPTQRAVKAYVDNAVVGLMDYKGGTSCSGNPNYPAALKGDAYTVTSAGKIGGASGTSVDVGDVFVATADNAGGTQASVGTSWIVLEHNLVGALLAANNLSDLGNAATARTNLGVAIGTNVQAWDADLDAIAALTGTNTIYYRSAASTWSSVTIGGTLSFSGGTLAVVSAPILTTARNIDGQAFDGSAAITVIAPGTHAATSKATPADADELPLVDSAASNVLKKLTWANVKATLKTYFDTLYAAAPSLTALPFAAGWGNFGSPFVNATYSKTQDGMVVLAGVILNGGTGTTTLFTLPAGFRPSATRLFNVIANSAIGRLDINSSGVGVLTLGSSAAWVSLDGISFFP